MDLNASINKKPRVAFLVGAFPIISQTFIVNQIAELLDRNIEVEVFAFHRGDSESISSRYDAHRMIDRTYYLCPPASRLQRIFRAALIALHMLCCHPVVLLRTLNFIRYGREAWSLRLLYQVYPFLGKKFNVVHCHFGEIGNSFLTIKDLLKFSAPLVTTFYGYDASIPFGDGSRDFYGRLIRECDLFLVMSANMKQRLSLNGFPPEKIKVHPVSIDVDSYPFCERKCASDMPVEIVSIGRFVEKKGFDDLLRALAIVRRRSSRKFRCTIVGGGGLEGQLRALSNALDLDDVVSFNGYMRNQDIIKMMPNMHIMVQPSKTASNGDME